MSAKRVKRKKDGIMETVKWKKKLKKTANRQNDNLEYDHYLNRLTYEKPIYRKVSMLCHSERNGIVFVLVDKMKNCNQTQSNGVQRQMCIGCCIWTYERKKKTVPKKRLKQMNKKIYTKFMREHLKVTTTINVYCMWQWRLMNRNIYIILIPFVYNENHALRSDKTIFCILSMDRVADNNVWSENFVKKASP